MNYNKNIISILNNHNNQKSRNHNLLKYKYITNRIIIIKINYNNSYVNVHNNYKK